MPTMLMPMPPQPRAGSRPAAGRDLRRVAAITAIAALLGACALMPAPAAAPMPIDRSATAPLITGFGESHLAITTASPEARRWFEQGMTQAYAFNEVEAVRGFKAALAQDPGCAMCAWGVAWQLGPNINDPERRMPEAGRYAALAQRLAATVAVSARERGLIDAVALRVTPIANVDPDADALRREAAVLGAATCGAAAASANAKADPRDIVYADRMRTLVERFPDDPDVISIDADAEMVATRIDNWWDPVTGAPVGRIGTLTQRLEAALKTHPDHTGLNHYLIHAVDAPTVAARAEGAADRLAGLAPNSPHLLHMPAHTYLRIGRYGDASRLNQQALAAEDALDADLKRQGFDPTKDWRGHNGHFLWYAALMQGRGDLALHVARDAAAKAEGGSGAYVEYLRSLPSLTLLRLERWDALLTEPLPVGGSGDGDLATVFGESTHGVALARTGQPGRAAEALARLDPIVATLIAAHASEGDTDKLLRSTALVAQARLRAEVAFSAQRPDEAIAHEREAVTAGQEIDAAEPPLLAAGSRLALGDMQLRAQRWADAEQSFRADLADHPESGWALRGLAASLEAQGRKAEADRVRADLDLKWKEADAGLRRVN